MPIFFRKLSVILLLLALWGCQENDKISDEKAALSLDETSFVIPADGQKVTVNITSNCYWDVAAAQEDGKPAGWITISPASGQGNSAVELSVDSNIKTEERAAVIIVSTPASKELTLNVSVRQGAGEAVINEGYGLPIVQTIDIDSPETRNLVNAYISGNECLFKGGMIVSRSDKERTLSLECPSHTQPSAGDDADRSIHRSLRFDDFQQGESMIVRVPVKNALSGDLRMFFGARAASFTKTGWSYYWGSDGKTWSKIDVANATTPGSDAVFNNLPFSIPAASAIAAGDTLYLKFTADGPRPKTYFCLSNAFCIFPQKAEYASVPAMDGKTVAFSTGFDDLVAAQGAYPGMTGNYIFSATSGYASNYTSFNNQYRVDEALSEYSEAKGCYERPGFLQVGYYDESLWTRQCIGTYSIKIGERLKAMGISSADCTLSLKAGIYKDARGYDPLAKVTVSDGANSFALDLTAGQMKDCVVDLKGLTQASVITITTPKLTDEELAALNRGANAGYLQDYRFYIDDVVVKVAKVLSAGASSTGDNESFKDGGQYKW